MDFQQPQTTATDKEIEATLNALRLQISDKQAEIVRQEMIINSNRYTIQQTANEKAESLKQKEDIASNITILNSELEKLESDKTKLKNEIEVTISEINKQKNEINQKIAEFNIQDKKTQELKDEVIKEKEQIEKEKKELVERENELEKKIKLLKGIIN